jgi:hypothetical protein
LSEKINAARVRLHELLRAGDDTVKARTRLKQLEDDERIPSPVDSSAQTDADAMAAARVAAIDAEATELTAATLLRLSSVIQRFTV